MKSYQLLVLFFLTGLSLGYSQKQQRIGYIDMEYILENIEEYRIASNQLNQKVERWQVEMNKKQTKINQMRKDLSFEKAILTAELIEEKEEEIKFFEEELNLLKQNRFGPNGDYEVQHSTLIQPIQDRIFIVINEIAKEKKYDIIFDKSTGTSMIYLNKRYNLSSLVLKRIKRHLKQNGLDTRQKQEINKN